MTRTTIELDLDPAHESLIRDYAAFLDEMKHLAATAPHGSVLLACERVVVERGREQQRRVLEQAVLTRIDDAEKKGRR
jgi:hypothetical protein